MACSPVSFQVSQLSIVPKTALPSRARCASPSTLRSSHSIFVPEKYGSSTRPGALANELLMPLCAQLVAAFGGAAVLPDDRAVQRLAGRGVPDADGLALVRDPDRRQPAGRNAGVGERLERQLARDVPDLPRVVLDPARPGKMLLELAIRPADELGLVVEYQAGAARRALVDREDHGFAAYPRRILDLDRVSKHSRDVPTECRWEIGLRIRIMLARDRSD